MRNITRQILILLLIAAIPALVSAYRNPALFRAAPLASDEITLAQMLAWQRDPASPPMLLIDARPSDAFQTGHIPRALSLNGANWEQQLPALIERLGANTRIIIYCDDALCGASRDIAARLRRELDLKDIFIIKNGWREWLDTTNTTSAPQTPAAR